MILAVLKGNKINKLFLPDICEGSYIIKDYQKNVIGNLYAKDGKWLFDINDGYKIENSNFNSEFLLSENQEIIISEIEKQAKIFLYLYKTDNTKVIKKKIKTSNISIGSSGDIGFPSQNLKSNHAKLSKVNNLWYIEAIDNAPVYVNDRLVRRKRVEYGDIIFIYGLKIILISEYILVTSTIEKINVSLNNSAFEEYSLITQQINDGILEIEGNYESFDSSEEYMRSPRFRSTVKHEDIKITPPPQKQEEQTKPGILTIGPRLTMMLTSVVSLITVANNIMVGKATLKSSMLAIIVTVVTAISAFLWPALTNRWNKHEIRRNELKRFKKYREYLRKKEKEISNVVELQKQIILENNISLEDCQLIIYNKKRNLWERIISDDDFLMFRVGIGKVKPDIAVTWEEEDFAIDDDRLKDELKDLIKKYEYMDNMPMNISLINNRITAVIGNYALLHSFMQSVLLQIATFHMYSELKIVVFTDEDKVADWNYLKFLPHCWDNQHERRFIAATTEEKKQLSSYLESILYERGEEEDPEYYKYFNTYYLVIVDNIDTSRDLGIVNAILESKCNSGFSLLIKNDRIANLPRQCTTFININEDVSGIFETNLDEENQKQFKADFNRTVNVEDCFSKLSNIYVNVPKEKYELPKSIGFMEMYEVGNVEQFNSGLRWRGNNPVVSLGVPVGIDQNGDIFYMDIHEKAFGPHGLVAGTTGSGKSEWLITYILSLAVNFSPLEVQFVLIDYKGGGLAGSFENTETGMELPHLVGTITNLDKSEMRRSLAALESESKRRQKIFNEARDKLDDSSMDIYKYQQYYRKGLVSEPLSHLLIISDEFAELKSQEPEFLDSLVSIARVGRSLGIHLILATQKPSGVVTDQIWSNAKFKVCLKVQDKSDSKDMIKTDDAAYLRQTGAFYLQVGMNDFYAMGQSAYAGLKYQPTNIVKKKIDVSLDEIDRSGQIINSQEMIMEREENANVHGEELLNIIKYLDDLAEKQQIVAKKLWLTAIANVIFVDKLKRKYNFKRTPYKIEPLIGEYDDPVGQKQCDLRLNMLLSNIFVTGVAGSGKEMFLQSLIYSTITSYTPQEINFYIADFGAETLGVFEEAPHIGGVLYSSEIKELKNLLKMINKELDERKRKYRAFGGNYESNIKYGKEKDAVWCIVINGFDFLKDDYFEIKEEIERIMLDSAKYGIVFVISAIDRSAVKMRTLSNFKSIFVLHQNDDFEYRDILGTNARGIIPRNVKGRGLFRIEENVYEFQSATIIEEEEMHTQVKKLSEKLKAYYKHYAKPILSIPNPLTFDTIDMNLVNETNTMIGYSEKMLEPVYCNLYSNICTMITSSKKNSIEEYGNTFFKEINDTMKNIYMFDKSGMFARESYNNIRYYKDESAKNNLLKICDFIENYYNENINKKNSIGNSTKGILIINMLADIYKDLTEEEKKKLSTAIEYSNELKIFAIVFTDLSGELKTLYREETYSKLFLNASAIMIDSSSDGQVFIEIGSKDVRLKEMLAENQGYYVSKGKGTLIRVFNSEKIGSDSNEI